MNAVVDPGGVISSNNSDLDKKESVATLKKQKSISNVEGKEKHFDIPLSIFRYKGYDSDFFTSWYNILREIFEEIKEMCPEKRILNLALSVLMLPYIASISLGLVVYNRSKADGKIQTSLGENKTKKSEVSESTAKRLAYSVLAAIAILVNIVVLVTLIIPATLALATFYLLNKKLSHSLIATVKISNGLCQNEHQNIEVSFHEIEAIKADIKWNMEVQFPPQFEQLLRDLCEDKNDKLFVTQDAKHNTILKLSANIHLKNGLVPLRNEIRDMLATSIQGFTEAMGELLKLDKKDITYDKLKELLNEFRLKVVNSIGPKLTTHLIYNAYQVFFIQAIKFRQNKRGEDFSLEDELKNTLVKQELESQGKELPSKRDMIVEDLKNAGTEVLEGSKDDEFSVDEAEWKLLIEEGKIDKRNIVDTYKSRFKDERSKKMIGKALDNAEKVIKDLRKIGQERYGKIHEKLKEVHENRRNGNLTDSALKRKLENLFKCEYGDQEVEQRLIKSVMKKAKGELSQSGILDKEKPSLIKQFEDLEKNEKTSDEMNGLIEKMYLEVRKCKVQELLQGQKKGVLYSCGKLKKYDESDLAKTIEAFRKQDQKDLEGSALEQTLKDQNERLKAKLNDREEGHPCTKSIEVLLKRNEEILKALEQLESDKKESLINDETANNYKEKLTSHERIKFAIIEDDLLEVFKQETFNEAEIKKLLEKAELEYCLAEKRIKSPVIKTKDNIKHFCQDLLSPLISRLVNLIISNVPKNNQGIFQKAWNSLWTGLGYIRMGLSATVINKNGNVEGKALGSAHNAYKEVETFLQYFESSYEEVGGLIGNVFSDDGETFKKDIWPKIKNHLLGMWDRFFKDVEFTLISKDKNINQEIVNTELGQFTIQQHNSISGLAQKHNILSC